ncbi:hypothetical protein ACOMHN_033716 [Nucella lapillus]
MQAQHPLFLRQVCLSHYLAKIRSSVPQSGVPVPLPGQNTILCSSVRCACPITWPKYDPLFLSQVCLSHYLAKIRSSVPQSGVPVPLFGQNTILCSSVRCACPITWPKYDPLFLSQVCLSHYLAKIRTGPK